MAAAPVLVALMLVLLARPVSALFDEPLGDAELSAQRDGYQDAVRAARAGDWKRFQDRRRALNGYPLSPYLDYTRLVHRHAATPGREARAFVDDHSDSPLGMRYLDRYLRATGEDRRWGDYLTAAGSEPRSERLRCYYARAKRARGEEAEAWDMAERLWLSGSSVDDACDPLFDLWRRQGGLRDELVWERAKLAFAARESSLLRYIASLASPELQPRLEQLRTVYRRPKRAVALADALPDSARAEVVTLGLERYSRYDPAGALREWQSADRDALETGQRRRVERAIAFRALLERDDKVRDWLDAGLRRWGDDKLTAMRLRWAIAESDWAAIEAGFEILSDDARGEAVWRYWLARALEATGRGDAAEEIFAMVARERGYYGFLSADRLGLPYSYHDASTASPAATSAAQLNDGSRQALWRVHELFAVDEPQLAHSEWSHTVQRSPAEERLQLAQLAQEQGWYRLSIDAANAGRRWDYLDLRFPLAYVDDFRERASARSLPVSELMAIARRESAFFPPARSAVGARGLMQLMPSTGIAVAREAGLRLDVRDLYRVEPNLDLGSAYYRQLLDRFDGNRAVALAAYNAGPNRVQHWVGKGLPVDAWIETIPYRETRDYVKAVLAYSVVFDYRLGRDAQLMSASELSAVY